MVRAYKLIKNNYGLKAGEIFIYLECPNLYMRRVKIDGIWGGSSKYRFTPEQMVDRYFEPIKLVKTKHIPILEERSEEM